MAPCLSLLWVSDLSPSFHLNFTVASTRACLLMYIDSNDPGKLSCAASLGQDRLLGFGRSLRAAWAWEIQTLTQARINICKSNRYNSKVVLALTGATNLAVASLSWSPVVTGEASSLWAASPSSFPSIQIEGGLVFDKELPVPSLPLLETRHRP